MSFPIGTEDLEDRIRRISKTEPHMHIEGALPYEFLHELDPKRFPENPPGYRFLNFVEFETLLVDHEVAWFTGPERYHKACKRIFAGPEKIWEALDVLGAERVQHGVRTCEDPEQVSRLVDEGIILDICPISNEKLKLVDRIEDHPIRECIAMGVVYTANTDDPKCFANTITEELETLSSRVGLSATQVEEVAKNGFRHARMDESLKTSCIEEIDAIFSD